jgi:hypothetical protein
MRPTARRGPFLRAPSYDAWLEGLRAGQESSHVSTSELARALQALTDEELTRLAGLVAAVLPGAKGNLQTLLLLLVELTAPRGGAWAGVVPLLAQADAVRALRAVATSATDGAGPARDALREILERNLRLAERLVEPPDRYTPLPQAHAALAVELLVPLLAHGKSEARRTGAWLLGSVSPATPAQVDALAALVRTDPDARARGTALQALTTLRREAAPGDGAVAAVAPLLHDLLSDPVLVEDALGALRTHRAGEPTPPLAPLEALARTSVRHRVAAVELLGRVGPPAAPVLLWVLCDFVPERRREQSPVENPALAAAKALRDVGALARPEAGAALAAEFALTTDPRARHELLPLVGAAGLGAAELVPDLLRHAPGCWEDRCGALEALAQLAPADPRVQALVVELLTGDDATSTRRGEAVVAWAHLGCPERARCVPRVVTVHEKAVERALAASPAMVDALLEGAEECRDEELFRRLFFVGSSSTPERGVGPLLRANGRRMFDPIRLLAHFGAAAACAVPELARLLEYGVVHDGQAEDVASVLGLLGPLAASAIPALEIARARARRSELFLEGLGKIGPAALPALQRIAADPNHHVATTAFMAAYGMEPRPTAALRDMVSRHGVRPAHGSALTVLAELAHGEGGVAWLLALADDVAGPGSARSAILTLGELRAAEAVGPLMRHFVDGPHDDEAEEALWRIGAPAVGPLAALLDHEVAPLAFAARDCLARMTHAHRAAAEAGIRSRHAEVRAWAEAETALLR